MSRPPRARDAVLDAFQTLVLTDGPHAATMDAASHAAGVSKGGLLYHFPTKDALETALLERMEALAADDVEQMKADAAGIVAAFLRTSVYVDSPLDRALVAGSRLAQGGSERAASALRRVRTMWEDAVRPATRDDTALQLALLVADGLYFNNALGAGSVPGPPLSRQDLDTLIARVEEAVRPTTR